MTTATALRNPGASRHTHQWAHNVWEARAMGTQVHQSFIQAERHTADRLAPRGNTIFAAGDPIKFVEDLPATIEEEPLPE